MQVSLLNALILNESNALQELTEMFHILRRVNISCLRIKKKESVHVADCGIVNIEALKTLHNE